MFLAEQKPRRGEDRGERLGHAGLEGLPLPLRSRLRQRGEAVFHGVLDGTPERLLGELSEDFAGKEPALSGLGGDFVGKEAGVVRRVNPMFFVKRTANSERPYADCQRTDLLFAGSQRLEGDRQLMLAGFPVTVERIPQGFIVAPGHLANEEFLAAVENPHFATIEVEFAVDILIAAAHLEGKPVITVVFGGKLGRGFRRLVKRQQNPAVVVLASPFAAKLLAGDNPLGNDPGGCRHGLADDHGGSVEIFFEEQGGDRQDIAVVVEAMPGVVGGEFEVDVELNAEEVADSVLIFDPVEPADGDMAGVGIFRIDAEGVVFDPGFEPSKLLGGRTRLIRRRHDPRPEILQNRVPNLGSLASRFGTIKLVKRNAPFFDPKSMAVITKLLKNRPDLFGITNRGRRFFTRLGIKGRLRSDPPRKSREGDQGSPNELRFLAHGGSHPFTGQNEGGSVEKSKAGQAHPF